MHQISLVYSCFCKLNDLLLHERCDLPIPLSEPARLPHSVIGYGDAFLPPREGVNSWNMMSMM